MYLFSNRRTVSVKYKFSRGIHLSAHRYYCPPQHVSPPVFTFNLNQFKAFLVADEVHCLDELVKEATCKHPMNPRDISAQRPGQDRAPVPCPSGEQIPEEIRKRHEQARQFLEAKEKGEQLKAARAGGNKDSIANHTPTDPTVVVVAVEPSKTTTVPRSGKAPLATKDPHLTTKNVASSNVSSTVTSDKKYACPVCGKGFRLSMALEHHMVTKHESSSGAVSSAMANVKTTPAPSPVDVKPAPKASPSEAKDVPVSASQPHVSPTSSVAPPINALSTLIDELLSAWDTVGLQRLPHTFKVWKLLDQETIMKHGHALRAQVVAEKEQEKRQHTSSAPRCGISVEYTPANLSIATGESIPIDFNPFEVLQAAAGSSASLSTGGAPRPDETFNPFASLAQMTSEEGTSIPLGMSPLGGGGGGVFDASFDQSEAAKVGGGESLSMSTLSEIMPGTEEKRHACNICGKAFKTRDGLAGHYEVKHPGQKLGMTTAQSSDAQSDGKHTIGVSLESIPAYVPTPVDLSKIPGQGTSEADARAVMAAEDMRNNIPNLDMDLVIHARAHTNITLSGTVLDVTTGYDHQLLVTQFGVLVDCGHSEGPQTVTVRIYGERTVKAVREWLRDGALILVSGLLRMNPQPDTTNSSGKYFNNPYVLISDQRGAIIPLWG